VSTAVEIIINALTLGCTYALVGVGFVVIFRATKVISFGQGVFMMIGALLFAGFARADWPTWLGVVVAVVAMAALSALTYQVVFGRLAGLEPFVVAIGTVGLGTLFESVGLMIWGPSTIQMPQLFGIKLYHVYGPAGVNAVDILTMCVTAGAFLLVGAALYVTPTGLRMRAAASDASLAAYHGLAVSRLSAGAWAIGGGTAALAGIVFVIGTQPDPATIDSLGLLALPAILLGGFDSIIGCLVGGILIALVQTITVQYMSGNYQDVVGYLVLLLLLSFRPQGIFGRVDARRL
jgi:branched-chain amino acid transport system permease protein